MWRSPKPSALFVLLASFFCDVWCNDLMLVIGHTPKLLFLVTMCTHAVYVCFQHLISQHYRNPTSLQDVIIQLQHKYGLCIPTTDEEWAMCSRMNVDIRRSDVLNDGIREAKKTRFDPTKLLKVCYVNVTV